MVSKAFDNDRVSDETVKAFNRVKKLSTRGMFDRDNAVGLEDARQAVDQMKTFLEKC